MKILIVDDNEKVRQLIREYLPASVCEVVECSNGGQAVAEYRSYLPNWVLMDWEMPGKDGIAATREIIGEFPDAKICMVSAFTDIEIRSAAIAAGARAFVLKDNLSELESILRPTAGWI